MEHGEMEVTEEIKRRAERFVDVALEVVGSVMLGVVGLVLSYGISSVLPIGFWWAFGFLVLAVMAFGPDPE
jgi:hypothetical protein